MTPEPTPNSGRTQPVIDSGQLIAAPKAEAHALFIHRTASTLVDGVANALGRGSYLPNEREALHITNKLCAVMQSVLALRCCHYSSVENPIAIWDHEITKPTRNNEITGPQEECMNWVWKANHSEMLNTFVRFVREACDEGSDLSHASHIALMRFMLYAGNPDFKVIESQDETGLISIEDSISRISQPTNFPTHFEQEIQISKNHGAVSPDCSDKCDTNSHAELVRMRHNDNSLRLEALEANFNLGNAPELSIYSLKDSRELFRNTTTALREDPTTQRNLAYVAASEALSRLMRKGEPTTFENVLKSYAKNLTEFQAQLTRLGELNAASPIIQSALDRIEFYTFLLQVLPEQRHFLEGALDCK